MPLRASTVRAEDVESGDQEATSDEGRVALVADETVVVPVTFIKRYELGRAKTSNRTHTATALLSEIVGEAVLAVRLLLT